MSASDSIAASRLTPCLRLAALLLGALQAYCDRHGMNPDGISYLDLAEEWRSEAGMSAVSTYWSPLYPRFIGLMLDLLHPSAYWEFATVKLLNFLLLIGACATFEWLLHETRLQIQAEEECGMRPRRHISYASLSNMAYLAFIAASLKMIGLGMVTPDLLVSLLLYAIAALLTRCRRLGTTPGQSALLGVMLGLGYLAKAAMFPIGIVCLGISTFRIRSIEQAARHWGIVGLAFLLITSSSIAAMSRKIGRPTLGEVSRLNYLWYVDGLEPFRWKGGPATLGKPLHPPRQLLAAPVPVYEFAEPVRGTYPLWFDPPYWCRGLSPEVNLRRQWTTIGANGRTMWKYASEDYALLSLAILLLHLRGLCELSGTLRDRFRQYLEGWAVERDLWLPSVAAVGMYLLVHIETRFLGGFAVLFTIGSLGSLRTARPALASSRKTDFLAAGLVAILCGAMVLDAAHASRTIVWGEPPGNHPCWEAATALREEHGLAPGSKLAVIGDAFHCGWARLGRYRIVAQIEPQDAERFHDADAAGQQAVLQALRRTGVQAVVAEEAAELSSQWFTSPWLPIRGSRPGLHLQIEDSGALDE